MALDPSLTEFTTASPYILSFDFDDFVEATLFKAFYLLQSVDTTGLVNILTPSANFYSNTIENTQAPGTGVFTFDSPEFTIPRTVKGTAIFNMGTVASVAGGDDTVKARLYKWDGSSATAITSEFTKIVLSPAGVVSFSMLCTETLISAGEQLRLIVTVRVVGGGEFITWGHDPAGRTGTTGLSSSRINIPFKFDG